MGMRQWEFIDDKAAPLNIVFEQDFVLHIRRLKKQKKPFIVANLLLSAVPSAAGAESSIEDLQNRIKSFMQAERGTFAPMANGDVFLTWEVSPDKTHMVDQILKIAIPHGGGRYDQENYLRLFKLPDDYVKIRETTDEYLKASTPAVISKEQKLVDCIRFLQSERARGDLTAWSVTQIEGLVKRIELHNYILSQPIYNWTEEEKWERICDEAYIGLAGLHQKYFPHTDVHRPKHLFLELCQFLDSKFLMILKENYDSIKGMNLSLNFSIPTVLGVDFAMFTRSVPKEDRGNFGFEVHCGDVLQDFEVTLNMIQTMREEGFNIALDGVTPNMLEYFDFSTLNLDAIKINVSKANVRMLGGLKTQRAIMMIEPEKVIFSHCDNKDALEIGKSCGISKFQGFLIDELAMRQVRQELTGKEF